MNFWKKLFAGMGFVCGFLVFETMSLAYHNSRRDVYKRQLPFHGKASTRKKQAPASVNHWQEPVYFLQLRHPQTMQDVYKRQIQQRFGDAGRLHAQCMAASATAVSYTHLFSLDDAPLME